MTPEPPQAVPLAAALREKVRRDFAGAPDHDIDLLASLLTGEPDPVALLGLGPVSHIARYHVITSALMREGRWVHAFRSAARLERAERAYVRELRDRTRPPGTQPPASAINPRFAAPEAPRSSPPPSFLAPDPALDPGMHDAIRTRVEAMTPEEQRARLGELMRRREAKLARAAAARPQDPPTPDPAPPRPPGLPAAPYAPVPDG